MPRLPAPTRALGSFLSVIHLPPRFFVLQHPPLLPLHTLLPLPLPLRPIVSIVLSSPSHTLVSPRAHSLLLIFTFNALLSIYLDVSYEESLIVMQSIHSHTALPCLCAVLSLSLSLLISTFTAPAVVLSLSCTAC